MKRNLTILFMALGFFLMGCSHDGSVTKKHSYNPNDFQTGTPNNTFGYPRKPHQDPFDKHERQRMQEWQNSRTGNRPYGK